MTGFEVPAAAAVQALDSLLFESGQTATGGWRAFVQSWLGFLEWRVLARVVASLLCALALAATLAYHPRTRGGAVTVAQLEAPKTLLLYAVIGTIVAQIVVVLPAMAFVVFGIGGLLRFRTEVGASDDTGLVILVTVVGIACGLNLFPLAVLSAATGWVLLYVLEGARAAVLSISGLDGDRFEQAVDAHTEAIAGLGVTVLGSRPRRDKGRLNLTLKLDRTVSHEDVASRLERVPEDLRGALEWEEN